jgi:hypothetical protein
MMASIPRLREKQLGIEHGNYYQVRHCACARCDSELAVTNLDQFLIIAFTRKCID